MSILDTLITDRVPGATYDWRDLNRVEEAMEYVANRLREQGIAVELTTQQWARYDKPTESAMENYITQIGKLRALLALPQTTPPVPAAGRSRPYLTVQEANDIERILHAIDETIQRLIATLFYCGEIHSGEG